MKKKYEKPTIESEPFAPEMMLASCDCNDESQIYATEAAYALSPYFPHSCGCECAGLTPS